MLVDRMASLRNIFGGTDLLIAAHCEDQGIIKENTDKYKKEYGDDVPLALHPLLRSEDVYKRQTVGRAIYKGILQFITNQHDKEYIVQPLPVSNFAIQFGKKKNSLFFCFNRACNQFILSVSPFIRCPFSSYAMILAVRQRP